MTTSCTKSCLLLLSSPPPELSFSTVQAAYGLEINDALRFVKHAKTDSADGSQVLQLDIAVISQDISFSGDKPRSFHFAELQRLVGLLYQLVEISVVKNGFVDDHHRFDYRILFAQSLSKGAQMVAGSDGPHVTLSFLVCNHPAEVWLIGQSEEANKLHHDVLAARGRMPIPHFIAIGSGSVMKQSNTQSLRRDSSAVTSRKPHYTIAVGGTFDHLHAGHKLLLTATAFLLEPNYEDRPAQERCLIVGITGDKLLENKQFAEQMESWELREERTFNFLLSIMDFWGQGNVSTIRLPRDELNRRAVHHTLSSSLTIKCVEILDAFGPTITDKAITALVLSGETRAGGSAVNDKRLEKGWPPLEVFEVDVLDQSENDKDFGQVMQDFRGKISSTDIRRRLQGQAKPIES